MSTGAYTHPVATVYAEALLEAAGVNRDAIGAALAAFVGVLDAAPDLRIFLETPALQAAAKKPVLEKLRGQMDDILVNFLCVVVDKRRADLLGEMAAAYRDLADRAANRARAQLTAAMPVDDDQRATIARIVSQRLDREIILEATVDPRLIGGIIVQVGDRVLEASVHGWLEQLRKEMVRSSGYEN
jgi:F-type H+-transporting ATPase subunit delta